MTRSRGILAGARLTSGNYNLPPFFAGENRGETSSLVYSESTLDRKGI